MSLKDSFYKHLAEECKKRGVEDPSNVEWVDFSSLGGISLDGGFTLEQLEAIVAALKAVEAEQERALTESC